MQHEICVVASGNIDGRSWRQFYDLTEFQIVDFGRNRALQPAPFFAFSRHLEWGEPSRNGPIVSGIKF